MYMVRRFFMMGMKGFDWATSNGMDNTRQRLAKSKKPINANASKGEVTVSAGKGIRFSARGSVKAETFAV